MKNLKAIYSWIPCNPFHGLEELITIYKNFDLYS